MLKSKSILLQIFCFVVGLSLLGCEDDKRETPTAVSVYRIVKEDVGNYSYLATAIDRAGLQDVLENGNNITLLAPTDQAFINAGFASVNAIRIADPVVLENILRYHIIENKVETAGIEGPEVVAAMDGNELYLDKQVITDNISYYVNGADILGKDNKATNGTVQLINKVLVPKKGTTIMEALAGRAEYSLFLAAINRASLGSRNYAATLASAGEYTVFAPTNTALADFLSGKYSTVAKIDAIDPDTVGSELVGNHIVDKAYISYKLPYSLFSLNSGRITSSSTTYFSAPNSGAGTSTIVNGSLLIKNNADELVYNGFVNGVNTVFAVPSSQTLYQSIESNTSLTYFKAAIEKVSAAGVDIKGLLSSPGTITVFAPTNQSFRDEGYESIDIINATNADILVELIAKHIFDGAIYSDSYPSGTYTLLSINGVSVEFDNTVTTSTYAAKGPLNDVFGAIFPKNEIRANGVFNIINQIIK
ncbi:fasciclin domain-containing protein [Flavobacterium fluviatile]|uniref:fasciclin domain-containing protein n=1 Tax=Flavobacterium fluviatile TaxID=1862387 RepID=UPI0013D6E253|nr:fasciclin domain-containing protein [Flavobacterium fluviatile]